MRRLWLVTAIATVASLAATGAAGAAGFEAGAAAVEITPVLCPDATPDAEPESYDAARGCFRWIHLAGFSPFVPFRGDNRLAAGVHDPLWARALALRDDDGDTLVLLALDLPGMGRQHTGPIRRRVERELDIPVGHVIIHSTHTHSAPDASGYWSTLRSDHNDHYTAWLRDRVIEAIREAVGALRPATLTTATTTHLACADRLTGRLKHENDCRLPVANHQIDDVPDAWDRFVIQRDLRESDRAQHEHRRCRFRRRGDRCNDRDPCQLAQPSGHARKRQPVDLERLPPLPARVRGARARRSRDLRRRNGRQPDRRPARHAGAIVG